MKQEGKKLKNKEGSVITGEASGSVITSSYSPLMSLYLRRLIVNGIQFSLYRPNKRLKTFIQNDVSELTPSSGFFCCFLLQ